MSFKYFMLVGELLRYVNKLVLYYKILVYFKSKTCVQCSFESLDLIHFKNVQHCLSNSFFSSIVLQSHTAINVGLPNEIVLIIETVSARILITVYRGWYLIIDNDDNNYNNTQVGPELGVL